MSVIKKEVLVGKRMVVWRNLSSSTYTAKLTFYNPKPLPAKVSYWAGSADLNLRDAKSIKLPANSGPVSVDIQVDRNAGLNLYTTNRDITVELIYYSLDVSDVKVDLTQDRKATISVGVKGHKGDFTVSASKVQQGVFVNPKQQLVRGGERVNFEICASKTVKSIRTVDIGIVDKALKSKRTTQIEVDCRRNMAKIYESAKHDEEPSSPPVADATPPVEPTQTPAAHAIRCAEDDPVFQAMAKSYFNR